VEKAIQILEALGRAPEGLDLQDVAGAAGMSPPGAYRTLQTLVRGGLAVQDGRRGVYRLGPRILVLARSMQGDAALLAAAEPELHALADIAGESVALAVVRGDRIWSIASATGSADVVAQPRLAHGEPYFHTTGRGKLYLAHLPPPAARALIARTGLPAVGPNTITDEGRLWREVEEARRRGYAVNRAERSPHLAGVAIPVFDSGGALAATLGISVPVYTLTAEREAELAGLGRATARRIEARLAGAGPVATDRSPVAQASGSTVSVARQQYQAATER
jgi:DNA-binding IclR family transcriptional regulator